MAARRYILDDDDVSDLPGEQPEAPPSFAAQCEIDPRDDRRLLIPPRGDRDYIAFERSIVRFADVDATVMEVETVDAYYLLDHGGSALDGYFTVRKIAVKTPSRPVPIGLDPFRGIVVTPAQPVSRESENRSSVDILRNGSPLFRSRWMW